MLSFIPGLRSQTTGRLLLINIISWVFLAVGDNAVRETEALGETLARVGLAQFVVFLLMVGWATAKKKGAAEIKTGKPTVNPKRAAPCDPTEEQDEPWTPNPRTGNPK